MPADSQLRQLDVAFWTPSGPHLTLAKEQLATWQHVDAVLTSKRFPTLTSVTIRFLFLTRGPNPAGGEVDEVLRSASPLLARRAIDLGIRWEPSEDA